MTRNDSPIICCDDIYAMLWCWCKCICIPYCIHCLRLLVLYHDVATECALVRKGMKRVMLIFFAILCSSSMQSCVALTLKCATQTNVSRLKNALILVVTFDNTNYNISIRKNAIMHFYSSIVSCTGNLMWEYYDPIYD